jgi:hypothetical protein
VIPELLLKYSYYFTSISPAKRSLEAPTYNGTKLCIIHIYTRLITNKNRQDLTASSQLRPFAKRKHIPTTFNGPDCSSLADLFFRHAAQCTQCAVIRMVRQEAMIVQCQTADDVSAAGSAVSGVFDGVGLGSSVKVQQRLCSLTQSRAMEADKKTYLDDRFAFGFFFDRRRRILWWICGQWVDGWIRSSVFPGTRRQNDDVLIGHDSSVGEDQAVAVDACTLSLAKLAGHLGQSVHTVVVTGSTERGEAAEESQRCCVR